MSSAIEVLKKVNDDLIEVMHMTGKKNFSYKCNQEKFSFALDEAIVCLEQKEKLKEWLEKEIENEIKLFNNTADEGEFGQAIIHSEKSNIYKKVLELMK